MTGCCFSCFFKLSFCWILPHCMLVAQVSLLKQQNYFEFNFQFSPGWFTLLHPLPLRSCLHKQALELESQMKLYSLRAAPPPPPQSSCLENPMDRGASWATVHRAGYDGSNLAQHTVGGCQVGGKRGGRSRPVLPQSIF